MSRDEQASQWKAYEAAELAAGRCPHSGLGLYEAEPFDGSKVRMCAVCDCFGYPLAGEDGAA